MSFALAGDVRYRVLFDEGVVIRQQEAEVLGVNPVGARILDCVRERRGREEMVEVLGREFDVEPAVLARDVDAFLAELVEIGVVTETEDGDEV